MGMRARVLGAALLASTVGCGRAWFDTTATDAAAVDATVLDAAAVDAAAVDGAMVEAATVDAIPGDAAPDARDPADAGPPPDAGPPLCPTGYVRAPPLSGYTVSAFCVAKYEMKNVGGTATAAAAGTPWTSISRDAAITACRTLGDGYDLITNAQWQTIVRHVADTAWNWSSGTAYLGQLNQGHSDSAPATQLAATTDDNDACFGTGETCSGNVWHNQRRTNQLADGTVIWDLGGNSLEFMQDDYTASTTEDYVSMFQGGGSRETDFGNDQFCEAPAVAPHCGYGYGYVTDVGGTIARGGGLDWGETAGIFTTIQWMTPTQTDWNISFRCVFNP
jgi:hypothetical protein